MAATDQEQQMAQAEEILGERLEQVSFAKGLFFGQYLEDSLPPYPDLQDDERANKLVEDVTQFCAEKIDPDAIDRRAEIPAEVISGLGKLGVLGACLPQSCGGMDLSQTSYCRVLEVLGGHCGSTALFVNAHHSIGPRALVLFGTPQQQEKWLPKLASGESISAFALTEPEAGSDAANVQTQAAPTEDGSGYLLNGEKRWITNGGVAQVLTVMARTPVPGEKETKITAFLVTPDTPGFKVLETRMEKCGVRGTATGRLEFRDMFVPRENILGPLGKGLRIALTVLDFGRVTFGACCTGAAKFCVERSIQHANQRVQFNKKLREFELVQEKIAHMQSGAYAMEACTYATAALIDSGAGDFMLETAMLKVFATEVLWKIINDTFQLHGGMAYFTDQPFERMIRDARLNTIGEGSNDVLRVFTALVGMRDVGLELEGVLNALLHPVGGVSRIGRFASRKIGSMFTAPVIDTSNDQLDGDGQKVGRLIGALGKNVEKLLRIHQKEIVDRQHLLARIADAAIEIFVSVCVLRRLDAMLYDHRLDESRRRLELDSGRYYLKTAERRIRSNFASLWDNEDAHTNDLARRALNDQA